MAGPEAPRVVDHEPVAVVELEPDADMPGIALRVVEDRRGHPQVLGEDVAAVEPPEQVLPAAVELPDAAAGQLEGDGLGRLGRRPPGIEDLDPLEHAAL